MDAGSKFERQPCRNATPRRSIDCILRVKTSCNVVVGIIRFKYELSVAVGVVV